MFASPFNLDLMTNHKFCLQVMALTLKFGRDGGKTSTFASFRGDSSISDKGRVLASGQVARAL